MKETTNYYVDDRNNRWSKLNYTKDQAEKSSKTLTYCSHCYDCADCYNCSHCADCYRCYRCSHCSHCSDCFGCSHCFRCSNYSSNPSRLCNYLNGTTKALAQVYWLDDNVQVVFGCWKGTSLDKFKKKTKERLNDDQAQPFYDFIKVAKYAIKELK